MRAGLIIITVTSLFGNPIGKLVQSSLNWFNYISYKLTSNILLVFQCSTCSITCWRVCVAASKGEMFLFRARACSPTPGSTNWNVLKLFNKVARMSSSRSNNEQTCGVQATCSCVWWSWNKKGCDGIKTNFAGPPPSPPLLGRVPQRTWFGSSVCLFTFTVFVFWREAILISRLDRSFRAIVGNVFRWSWLTRWPHRPMVTIGTWLKQWICCERVPSPLLLPKDKTNKQQLATKD